MMLRVRIFSLFCVVTISFFCCSQASKICQLDKSIFTSLFPSEYFKQYPKTQLIDDTLTVEFTTFSETWHPLQYSAASASIEFLLDSLNCYDVESRLYQEGIYYRVFNSKQDQTHLAEFRVTSAVSFKMWKDPSFRKFNYMILDSDPNFLDLIDRIIYSFYEDTSDPKFDTTMMKIYFSKLENEYLSEDELMVLDSLQKRAKINHEIIDYVKVKRLVYELKNISRPSIEELRVKDQNINSK